MRASFIALAAAATLAASGMLSSCGGSADKSDAPDTLNLTATTFIPYDDLRQPGLILTYDSSIYLINYGLDTIIDQFDTAGNFQRSFLRKGAGPDEVSNIFCLTLDNTTGKILMVGRPNTLTSISLQPGAKPLLKDVFTYTPGADTIPLANAIYRMADGTILASTQSREGYFAEFGPDGTFRRYAVNTIPLSDYGEGLPPYMVANFVQPMGAVSPDGKHFACSFGAADMLAFGTLGADSVSFHVNYMAPPVGIQVVVGDGYSSFTYADEFSRHFYSVPYLTGDAAYFLYTPLTYREKYAESQAMINGEVPEASTVLVYDFEGNHIRTLNLPVMAHSIAVSLDGDTLYALTEGPDGYTVAALPLPSDQ